MLRDTLTLYAEPDRYVLESKTAGREYLVLERRTATLTCHSHVSLPVAASQEVLGVLGLMRLLAGQYLVMVRRRERVGTLLGADVYKLTEAALLPLFSNASHLTPGQQRDEQRYIDFFLSTLHSGLFFSYNYDLTSSVQRKRLQKFTDHRFFWNREMCAEFLRLELVDWILPLIQGFVDIREVLINGHPFSFALLSRRSPDRAGTRLHTRGVDKGGNVANFVETEQIVMCQGHVASYVQIRGSVPLFWQQRPNLTLKPKPRLQSVSHDAAFRRHATEMLQNYGNVTCVNLTDCKAAEKSLGAEFERQVEQLKKPDVIRFMWFDFHKECKGGKYENLQKLMDRVNDDLHTQRYFLAGVDDETLSTQEGVMRTNCVDCLDRTNVCQALFARFMLNQLLRRLNVLEGGEAVEHHEAFMDTFRNLWADNADQLSTQYAGNGAQKTDYTRRGRRTKLGMCTDVVNSVQRYFINNFMDGARQDALDLSTKKFVPDTQLASPFVRQREMIPVLVLLALAVSLTMFLVSFMTSEGDLLRSMFWLATLFGVLQVILRFGEDFASKPVLMDSVLRI